MLYAVNIEARVYGDVNDDAEKLLTELAKRAEGMESEPTIAVDEERRMMLAVVHLDAQDGRDAHDTALELLDPAWEAAFGDMAPPSLFAITARPGRVGTTPAASLREPTDEDIYADVDEELEREAEAEASA